MPIFPISKILKQFFCVSNFELPRGRSNCLLENTDLLYFKPEVASIYFSISITITLEIRVLRFYYSSVLMFHVEYKKTNTLRGLYTYMQSFLSHSHKFFVLSFNLTDQKDKIGWPKPLWSKIYNLINMILWVTKFLFHIDAGMEFFTTYLTSALR